MSARELTTGDIGKSGLHEWLAAHDLDPRRVSAHPGCGLVVRDGQITATLYVVDENGIKQFERAEDVEWDDFPKLLTEILQMPVRVPLPDHLGRDIP